MTPDEQGHYFTNYLMKDPAPDAEASHPFIGVLSVLLFAILCRRLPGANFAWCLDEAGE